MKKKLTLLIFSLLCTLGLWAQVTADVTIINGSTDPGTLGTFSDLSTHYSTWTAANGVKITNETGKYALNKASSGNDEYGKCLTINFVGEDLAHTITMTAPEHMKIAGYKFYAKGSTGGLTFTMTGGTPTSISALTYTKFEKTGLNDQEVSFGITASKAGALWISELTLTLVAESGYYTLYKIYYDGSEVANSDFYAQSSVNGKAPSLDVRYKRGYCDYTYYSDAELTSSLATISSNDIVYVKCQLSAGCPVEFSTLGSPIYYTILNGRYDYLGYSPRYLKNTSGAISYSEDLTISNLWAFIGNPYSYQLYNFEQKGYLYCPNVVKNGSTLSVGETGSNLTLFDNSSYGTDTRTGKVTIAFRSDGTGLLNGGDNYTYYYAHNITRDASGAINNMGWSYVLLNKVTNYAPYISQYISSINSNYTLAGNVGYPKTSSTGYTALKAKIDGFSGEASYTLSDYNAFETAYATYTNETDVVIPSVGKFYTIYSPNANKYIHSVTPNSTLALNTSGTSADAIFYIIDSNARFLSYSNGYAMGDIKIWNTTYSSGGYYTYSIDHVATQDFGTLRINYSSYSFFQNGSTVGNTSQAATRTGEKAAWIFTEVTSLPITMHEVSGVYYATIKLPVAVEIPSGLSAYSAVADGTTLTLTKVVENGVLAANTPVILYSESDVTTLDISNDTGASPAGTNELSGTIDAASVTANANYVLSSGSEGVGFYKYNNTVMPGFRAYLPSSATSNVKAFTFSFEDAEDAIRAIESENSGLEIYDISGRRVQKAQKGLYIVNGKKVMFK
jgi:hypothetical protein